LVLAWITPIAVVTFNLTPEIGRTLSGLAIILEFEMTGDQATAASKIYPPVHFHFTVSE
jgi:hypothetical protein